MNGDSASVLPPPRRADITYRPRTDLTQLFFGFLSLHAYQTINPIRLDQVYQDINPNGVRDLSYQIKAKCQLSPAKGRTEASPNKVQTLNPMIISDILLSFCVADFYPLLKREYQIHRLHQITFGNRQPFDKSNGKSLPPKARLDQLTHSTCNKFDVMIPNTLKRLGSPSSRSSLTAAI